MTSGLQMEIFPTPNCRQRGLNLQLSCIGQVPYQWTVLESVSRKYSMVIGKLPLEHCLPLPVFPPLPTSSYCYSWASNMLFSKKKSLNIIDCTPKCPVFHLYVKHRMCCAEFLMSVLHSRVFSSPPSFGCILGWFICQRSEKWSKRKT